MRIATAIAIVMACIQAVAGMTADSLRVSFVNCYPGSDIYELEGHSALRVQYRGMDMTYSYGMFDFAAPNFVYRFVKGETDYWVDAVPWPYFVEAYRRDDRRIVEHPVELDSAQSAKFLELLADNMTPENRVYRYNYVKDNCSLRPLRLLQSALGDSIDLPEPPMEAAADHTYRQVMRRYHRNYPWYQLGIDLALGSGIDRPITAWDKAFAPVVLDSQLPLATVGGRRLTRDPIVVNAGRDVTLGPTPWWQTPLAVGWLVFALALLATVRDVRRCRVTRWFDAVLYLVYGVAGLVLAFLVFVSTHEATSPNWLVLWLNPLCLIVPIFIWIKCCKIVVYSYQIANFAMLVALAVAWPWTGQSGNAAFVPLIACDAMRSISYLYVTTKNKKA